MSDEHLPQWPSSVRVNRRKPLTDADPDPKPIHSWFSHLRPWLKPPRFPGTGRDYQKRTEVVDVGELLEARGSRHRACKKTKMTGDESKAAVTDSPDACELMIQPEESTHAAQQLQEVSLIADEVSEPIQDGAIGPTPNDSTTLPTVASPRPHRSAALSQIHDDSTPALAAADSVGYQSSPLRLDVEVRIATCRVCLRTQSWIGWRQMARP